MAAALNDILRVLKRNLDDYWGDFRKEVLGDMFNLNIFLVGTTFVALSISDGEATLLIGTHWSVLAAYWALSLFVTSLLHSCSKGCLHSVWKYSETT